MVVIIWILFIVFVGWAISQFYLHGENLEAFDQPSGEQFSLGDELNDEHRAILANMSEMTKIMDAPKKVQLELMREFMDHAFDDREFTASFTPVDVNGVPAEWVQAPGVDGSRRVLYIHGGAYMMGSPLSHRPITVKFSQIANAAVLAIDYRLMPENQRIAGIEDCRTAYLWILEHGPDGKQPLSALAVAGDSAGGNLTLSTIAWVRDQGFRAPDAVVALSPATDSTMASPSFAENVKSDAMLGPALGPLLKIPRPLLLWGGWINNRIHPAAPEISPAFGDLSGLPPVLVHVSDVEMLRDDGRRYANKAAAAGSPVKLQSWNNVVHVWHIFEPDLTEARQAFDEIEKFLADHMPAA